MTSDKGTELERFKEQLRQARQLAERERAGREAAETEARRLRSRCEELEAELQRTRSAQSAANIAAVLDEAQAQTDKDVDDVIRRLELTVAEMQERNAEIEAQHRRRQELMQKIQSNCGHLRVANPEGDPTAGTVVSVRDGAFRCVEDDSVLAMALSYTEPRWAAGIAIFGLGLLALPLLMAASGPEGANEAGAEIGSSLTYARARQGGDATANVLTEVKLRQRLGELDPQSFAAELRIAARDAEIEVGEDPAIDAESERVEQCVLAARSSVRRLRQRSALAFMGLPPAASQEETVRKYKRLALEMHPDKGGDPERFQLLQEMRQRLSSSVSDAEDADEKRKAEEEREERQKLEPSARNRRQRQEARKEAKRLWSEAQEAEEEMQRGYPMEAAHSDYIMSQFESFVQHHSSRLRTLPQGDQQKARGAFSQFIAEGLELMATAALVDAEATARLIESHISYKITARSGSDSVARDAQQLVAAVAQVRKRADDFLTLFGRDMAQDATCA